MLYKRFEDLPVWKDAMNVALEIYRQTSQKTFFRDRSLTDQMRRAAVSISSNIVEGFEKNSDKDFSRFLKIAKGSAGELRSQVRLAARLDYLPNPEAIRLISTLENLSKQLSGFISYLLRKQKC